MWYNANVDMTYSTEKVGRRTDAGMTIERKVSSIESSFRMENMNFDKECRMRVQGILSNKIIVADALAELNKKYGVSPVKYERS